MITARGRPMDWQEGLTVNEVLLRLGYALPIVIVNMNGKQVPRDRWMTTSVPDGAEIGIFPIMAGG